MRGERRVKGQVFNLRKVKLIQSKALKVLFFAIKTEDRERVIVILEDKRREKCGGNVSCPDLTIPMHCVSF